MKTSKKMKWAVALMLLPMVLFMPSIINFFMPQTYIDIYLQSDAGITIQELIKTQNGVALTLIMAFQGMGFTIIAYHLLGWPLILIPYKRGEKWAWVTLLFAQLWLWIENLVIESIHSDSLFLTLYSVVAISSVIISLILSFRTVFNK